MKAAVLAAIGEAELSRSAGVNSGLMDNDRVKYLREWPPHMPTSRRSRPRQCNPNASPAASPMPRSMDS
jgi:hypothetical protein